MKIFPNLPARNFSVSFQTAKPGKISITIYDANGNFLSSIFTGFVEKGILQQVEFKDGKLPPGTYIARLQGQDEASQQKFVILKN